MELIPLLLLSPRFLLIAAAVIPAVLLIIFVYRQDRLEKESWGMIFKLVLFGAISTLFAQVTETIGIALLAWLFQPGGLAYNLVLYFVVVGLSEEGFKYLILRWRTWNSPEFNCRFDGVVYATAVSLGFALWENISYVISYGIGTAMVRAVTAVPGHACFGVFMGAFYGVSKLHESNRDEPNAKQCKKLSVIVPVLLHGTYDFIASRSASAIDLLFVAFIGFMFWFAYRTVKKLSAADHYI